MLSRSAGHDCRYRLSTDLVGDLGSPGLTAIAKGTLVHQHDLDLCHGRWLEAMLEAKRKRGRKQRAKSCKETVSTGEGARRNLMEPGTMRARNAAARRKQGGFVTTRYNIHVHVETASGSPPHAVRARARRRGKIVRPT